MVAQIYQVLVHEDFTTVELIVLLNAAEELVLSLLEADSNSVREVDIDLVAHVLSKNSRELVESLFKLAVFIGVQAVLVVVDVQLTLLDLDSEFLLVDVGLKCDSESHVRQQECAKAPLLDDRVRLDLKPLVKLKDH